MKKLYVLEGLVDGGYEGIVSSLDKKLIQDLSDVLNEYVEVFRVNINRKEIDFLFSKDCIFKYAQRESICESDRILNTEYKKWKEDHLFKSLSQYSNFTIIELPYLESPSC